MSMAQPNHTGQGLNAALRPAFMPLRPDQLHSSGLQLSPAQLPIVTGLLRNLTHVTIALSTKYLLTGTAPCPKMSSDSWSASSSARRATELG